MLSSSVIITIILLSIIQSIVGVGLLVFGTPTLLLIGHDYISTLEILLPCSLLISLMQTWRERKHIQGYKRKLIVCSVPAIVLGLSLVYFFGASLDLKMVIAIVMILTAVLRISSHANQILVRLLSKFKRLYLILMGLIHGISNMGGALLIIMTSNSFSEKKAIRGNIAFGYLVFALTQIVVLYLADPLFLQRVNLLFALIAPTTFYLTETLIFKKVSEKGYRQMITTVIALYGFSLFYSSLN